MSENHLRIGIYRHYKGGNYLVERFVEHADTNETLVVYTSIENQKDWVLELDLFKMFVLHNGKTIKRFQYIGDPSS